MNREHDRAEHREEKVQEKRTKAANGHQNGREGKNGDASESLGLTVITVLH